MRKILIIIFALISLISCGTTYIDSGNNIHRDNMDFIYLKNYNQFIYKSKINAVADTYIFYTNYFIIYLPKKIKHWASYNNEFFFEYNNRQIIHVCSSYKNYEKDSTKWIFKNIDKDFIWNNFWQYW